MRIPSLILTMVAAAAVLLVPTLVGIDAALPAAAVSLGLLVGAVAGLWPRVTGLRPSLVSSAVIALSGGAALATSLALPLESALSWWPACLAVGLLLAFVVQLLRGHEAEGKVAALAASGSAHVIVASSAGWGVWLRQAGAWDEIPAGSWWAAGGSVLALGLLACVLVLSLSNGWGAGGVSEPAVGRHGVVEVEVDAAATTGALNWVVGGLCAVLAAGLPAALLAQLAA
ncbi:MAG: hypothetical protein LBE25_13790 [Arthrobacter sp.]|nr:hypothetical protein [Arthrobacter sp.]